MSTSIAPSWVVPQGPFALVAGQSVTVPNPSADPAQINFAVVVNSSPFTLVVSETQKLGTVAAFTSDLFPLFDGGVPLTVTAIAPGGILQPGSDASLYVDWLRDAPVARTYPAAIGAGAIALSSFASGVPLTSGTLTPGTGTGPGAINVNGYAGATYRFTETLGVNPLTVSIAWYPTATAVIPIAEKEIVVPAAGALAGVAEVAFPHFGPFVAFSVNNGAAVGNVGYTFQMQNLTQPLAAWGSCATGLLRPMIICPVTAVNAPNGVSTVIIAATYVFAGPASWLIFWNNTTTGEIVVEYQQTDGSWQTLADQKIGAAPQKTDPDPVPVPLFLPANPIRIRVVNNSGGPTTPISGISEDQWRAA
jgi:hypothetical protein